MTLQDLLTGRKAAMAKALARIERFPEAPETIDLLDAAYMAPKAHVIGITGPPGVGKSTLTNALIAHWRSLGRTVGVIAVDPSSRRTGGALLGDRTRFTNDPEDQGVFVRSMAARDRLGGLAGLTVSAMILMRAVYNVVLIETVGVGQSETDIVGVADTVLFCIQPGSGDALQFMKAGIVEIPHICVVTKADMGKPAVRSRADIKGALDLVGNAVHGGWEIPVLLLSANKRDGIGELSDTADRHFAYLQDSALLDGARRDQASLWLEEAVRERFGREGLKKTGKPRLGEQASPFSSLKDIAARLV